MDRDAPLGRWLALGVLVMLGAIALVVLRSSPEQPAPPAASASPAPPAPEVPTRPAPVSAAPPLAEPMRDAGARAPSGELDLEQAPEAALMQEAERALARTPSRALTIVAVADRRFGEQHERRRHLEIEALVALEQIGASHAKAERFYRSFPESPAAAEIERLTGYHPRPWGPGR